MIETYGVDTAAFDAYSNIIAAKSLGERFRQCCESIAAGLRLLNERAERIGAINDALARWISAGKALGAMVGTRMEETANPLTGEMFPSIPNEVMEELASGVTGLSRFDGTAERLKEIAHEISQQKSVHEVALHFFESYNRFAEAYYDANLAAYLMDKVDPKFRVKVIREGDKAARDGLERGRAMVYRSGSAAESPLSPEGFKAFEASLQQMVKDVESLAAGFKRLKG